MGSYTQYDGTMSDARGQYIDAKFFFGGGTRAGFAIYERASAKEVKRCLRVEARYTGHSPVTMELEDKDMAELVAVLRGSRASFVRTVKRPGVSPKTVTIHYNRTSQPPNAWVLVVQQGDTTIKIAFDSGVAWQIQYLAIAMLKPLYPDMSDVVLWQMLSATGRAAPG